MLRTCAVKLPAMEFTLSVRSFQVPATPGTCAWPPSLPSVPTSRATRVTSEVNTLNCLIMVLTMLAERRNSPLSARPSTSSGTVCSRSPRATAVTVRVTAVVGHSRSSIRSLTEPSMSAHAPSERPKRTRVRVLPCLPTTSPTCSSCCAIR